MIDNLKEKLNGLLSLALKVTTLPSCRKSLASSRDNATINTAVVQSEYPESAADDEIASQNNMNSLEGTPSRMPVEPQGSLIDTSAVLDPSKSPVYVSYTSKITLLFTH